MLRFPSGSSSPNILASFAGKNRVWVISAPHASEGYYRLMMSLLKDDVYCELAERHIQQIVLFHQAGEEGGKVRRITSEGQILEQPLDPSLIPKLMSFLKLEKGKFSMVLLKKTLQVEERYPYPVRLEAMYEVIDQGPIRRIEKIRQKGFVQKCKASGIEGHVVQEGNNGGGGAGSTGLASEKRKEDPRRAQVHPTREPQRKLVTTKAATPQPPPTPRATTLLPTPVTMVTRATSRMVTVAARPTTTTAFPTTQRPWTSRLHPFSVSHGPPATTEVTTARGTSVSEQLYPLSRKEQQREKPQATRKPSKATNYGGFTAAPPTTLWEGSTRAVGTSRFRDNRTDRREHGHQDPNVGPGPHKPTKGKPPKKKDKILSNEYEAKYDLRRPTASQGEEELQVDNIPSQNAKESKKPEKLGKPEKEKKKKGKGVKPDKLLKNEKQAKKAEKKSKQEKEKNKKKKVGKPEEDAYQKPTPKQLTPSPKKSVSDLLGSFEGKRRLLLITTPKAENSMYVQQRDEYLESFCKMATRRISVITTFGPVNNSTLKIDHFQLGYPCEKGLQLFQPKLGVSYGKIKLGVCRGLSEPNPSFV
ncbi:Coiled-coil domain-containing protein 80 [Microtus ochrogaster]|uniref:Coiled-coil domain-containing protein 80 n=1 Tax=Microtus ochrogaster TaxID=79684 RepID=A0A8J6GKY8_MICOH|nr:Coiled-coil domain-containing protein 80 [Microtus ochrogaster]